jgi:hypothetical protein
MNLKTASRFLALVTPALNQCAAGSGKEILHHVADLGVVRHYFRKRTGFAAQEEHSVLSFHRDRAARGFENFRCLARTSGH